MGKKTLRKQFTTLLLLAVIIPITAVTGYNAFNTSLELKKQYDNTLSDNTAWTADLIKVSNKSSTELVDMMSKDPNANAIFANADSEKWLMESFNSFLSTHKDIMNVYFGLKDGRMLLSPKQELPKDFDPRGRSWYTKALMKNEEVVVTDPYEDAAQKGTYVITFAKAVKDMKSGEVLGVVGIDIKLSTLSGIVSNLTIGKGGYVTIIDKTGRIIAHRDKDYLGKTTKDEKWIDELINSKQSKGEYVVGGVNSITYVLDENETGWKIVGVVPKSELTKTIQSSIIVSSGISALFIVVVVIIGMMFSRSITKPIIKIVEILNKVKDGDFTVSIEKHKNLSHEVEAIRDSFSAMISDMVSILRGILDTSKAINNSSEALVAITQQSSSVGEEVSKAVQQISQGTTEQAQNLDESSIIVQELGEEVNNAIYSSKDMIKASKNVKEATEEGTFVVGNLRQSFLEASGANKELQQEIVILADKSNKISAITDTIKSITEQTSLLSLNASIEAARAGEAGRGFAVVAEEVRKLADQSSESAQQINKVIEEIRGSVNSVLQKIEQAINLNEKSEKSVEITNSSFKKIELSAIQLEENIEKVSSALELINTNKDSVIQRITDIATVSQETAATTEEVSASSEEQAAGLQEVVSSAEQLSTLAESLDAMVKKFKI